MVTPFDGKQPLVAVASRSFSDTAQLRKKLEKNFKRVVYNDSGKTLTGQDLIDFATGAEALIVGLEKIDSNLLNALPSLRHLSKYGVGLNNIDFEACYQKQISVLHTPGVNSYSVSELALSSAIQLLHRTPESQESINKGLWLQHRGRDLRGAIVGIIGCGHVGKQLVSLLSPFACKVLIFDKVYDEVFNRKWKVAPCSLDEVLMASDVVSIHLPLDSSTRGMISDFQISLMKPGAILLNYARGGIVDEYAVAERLQQGLLAGVAIDVYDSEPQIESPLIGMPKVISTCHIGGSTYEAVLAMGTAAINQLVDVYFSV